MRLIDAEQLVMHLSDYALQESPGWGSDDWGNKAAYDAISNCILAVQEAPTVDAVEVVRCKDCIYYEELNNNEYYCDAIYRDLHGDDEGVDFEPPQDYFCAYGQRRESDG